MSGKWLYGFLFLTVIVSCNSPKQQKKINDGKLFEKLKEQEGYLNATELKRLDYNFSLKVLDKYDFSGFDEKDTLAYFVRSGKYLWIASCYLSDENDNPFFCLKEEKERQFKLIRKGIIPELYGECSYELEKLVTRVGDYIFVSQRGWGNSYCEENPLVFHSDGRVVVEDQRLQLILRNCYDEDPDNPFCFERTFKYEFHKPILLIHVHEKQINWETEEVVGTADFDLRYSLQTYTVQFLDTLYK